MICLEGAQGRYKSSGLKALAGFVNVHDAVLLSSVNGKILWQTWRDREPGFNEIRELGRDHPAEILMQLVPPRPIVEPEPRLVALPPPPREWYHRRPVQLGMVTAVVAAFIGGYVWARYHEAARAWSTDITGFGTGMSGR